jgi:hypothetical protein
MFTLANNCPALGALFGDAGAYSVVVLHALKNETSRLTASRVCSVLPSKGIVECLCTALDSSTSNLSLIEWWLRGLLAAEAWDSFAAYLQKTALSEDLLDVAKVACRVMTDNIEGSKWNSKNLERGILLGDAGACEALASILGSHTTNVGRECITAMHFMCEVNHDNKARFLNTKACDIVSTILKVADCAGEEVAQQVCLWLYTLWGTMTAHSRFIHCKAAPLSPQDDN